MLTFRPGASFHIPGVEAMQPRPSSALPTWWDSNGAISGCVAAYAPKGAASLAASYINLANPGTYNATPGVAPTWGGGVGWTFNGTTQYLTTGIVPAGSYTLIARFSNSPTGYLAGVYKVSGTVLYAISPNVSSRMTYWNGTLYQTASSATSGVMAIAGGSCYLDGVLVGTTSGVMAAVLALYIGGLNTDGALGNATNGKIQALAIYNVTLTAGQVAIITAAMQAL